MRLISPVKSITRFVDAFNDAMDDLRISRLLPENARRWFRPKQADKYSPRCGTQCCESEVAECDILADDFDRADDTDLGPDWDEESSGAAIVSNQVELTTNNARVIATNPNPDNANTSVTVSFNLQDVSAKFRVYLGYLDFDNCYYCEIEQNYFRLVERIGGVVTQTQQAYHVFGALGWMMATVCLNGTLMSVDCDGVKMSRNFGGTPAGNYHGFGCGTADVFVDDFIAKKVSGPCETCTGTGQVVPCNLCISGFMPAIYGFEISGVTDDVCPAGDCDKINGLWLYGEGDCDASWFFPNPIGSTVCGNIIRFHYGVRPRSAFDEFNTFVWIINGSIAGTPTIWEYEYEWPSGDFIDCDEGNRDLVLPLTATHPIYGAICNVPTTVTFKVG